MIFIYQLILNSKFKILESKMEFDIQKINLTRHRGLRIWYLDNERVCTAKGNKCKCFDSLKEVDIE